VAVTVILGCAAYEAGNLLGAVSGISLLIGGDVMVFTILISIASALVLWSNRTQWISWLMTLLVAMMGFAFLLLALEVDYSVTDIVTKSFTPSWPHGSELVVLGLIGTTIVPYNLFIASGISKGQTVSLMRIGLAISVILGGIITVWILLAGTLVEKFSSFQELAMAFELRVGRVGVWALGIGLFAAGFSSAITSPFAASLIIKSTVNNKRSVYANAAWVIVLAVGFLFGISGVKPIPIILMVQAINGLILPLITLFLILLINDKKIIPQSYRHALGYNIILFFVLGFVVFIGLNNVDKSLSTFLDLNGPHWIITSLTAIFLVLAVAISKIG
jgi:Mn2+/Fe2+ NRAMP family transporter